MHKTQHVFHVIQEMIKLEEEITFYSVHRKAGVSKSFVYNNAEIRALIERSRQSPIRKTVQNMDTKDVMIQVLKKELQQMKTDISRCDKDETWREKYNKVLRENAELKKQLEKLYAQLY